MSFRVKGTDESDVERAEVVESKADVGLFLISVVFIGLGFFVVWYLYLPLVITVPLTLMFTVIAIRSYGVNEKRDGYNEGYYEGSGIDISGPPVRFVSNDDLEDQN